MPLLIFTGKQDISILAPSRLQVRTIIVTESATLAAAIHFAPLQDNAEARLAELQQPANPSPVRHFPRKWHYGLYAVLGLAIVLLVVWIWR